MTRQSSEPEARAVRARVWLHTACPLCGARPGQRCTGSRGQRRYAAHVERWQAYREPKPARHRHERSSWLIAGGYVEWCYQCGAWRSLARGDDNKLGPVSKWTRPTGIGGPNPAMKGQP